MLATGAVALGAAVYVRGVSPYQSGNYPLCPVYAVTGLYCAGCGSLRAMHDLGHGDLAGAWDMNPLALVAVPFLVLAWGAWLRRETTGRPRSFVAPPWAIWAILAVVVAYSVLRNVPALAPWLAP